MVDGYDDIIQSLGLDLVELLTTGKLDKLGPYRASWGDTWSEHFFYEIGLSLGAANGLVSSASFHFNTGMVRASKMAQYVGPLAYNICRRDTPETLQEKLRSVPKSSHIAQDCRDVTKQGLLEVYEVDGFELMVGYDSVPLTLSLFIVTLAANHPS
jgi:hypothetical protein